MAEYLYRAFGSVRYPETFDLDKAIPEVTVVVDAHKIIGHTPKGAWINDPLTNKDRWVATEGRKRWACPTKDEAIESLMHRNQHRVSHLHNQLRRATDIRKAMVENNYETQELVGGMSRLRKAIGTIEA